MASKVDQLMRNYDKIKQFPMDGNLMPLADPTTASNPPSSAPLGQLVDEHPGPMPSLAPPPRGVLSQG